MSDVTDPPTPAPGVPANAPPSMPIPAWSSLDAGARMVAGAGLVTAVIVLIGGVLGSWPPGEFLILTLLAALVAAGAAWFATTVERSMPGMAAPIATLAAAVVGVLAVFAAIELIFDLDGLDNVLDAAVLVILVVAAVALVVAAVRHDAAAAAAVRSTAQGPRLALAGLALVLIAWAINLASYWTMRQAVPSLAVLTLAALLVVLAGRGLPAISAWIGVALALVGAFFAIGLWGQLMRLGEDDLTLDVLDYLPFVIFIVGLVLIVVAGALSGLAAGASRPSTPPPTPPSTS
ncbi:MAG: hypothetical protein ACRDIL_12165 [Candidatus Limnocylindrales bacterium]